MYLYLYLFPPKSFDISLPMPPESCMPREFIAQLRKRPLTSKTNKYRKSYFNVERRLWSFGNTKDWIFWLWYISKSLSTSGVSPKRGIESGVKDSGPQITVLCPTLSSIGKRLQCVICKRWSNILDNVSDTKSIEMITCGLLPDRACMSPCWGQRGQRQIQAVLPRIQGWPQTLPGRVCRFAPGIVLDIGYNLRKSCLPLCRLNRQDISGWGWPQGLEWCRRRCRRAQRQTEAWPLQPLHLYRDGSDYGGHDGFHQIKCTVKLKQ